MKFVYTIPILPMLVGLFIVGSIGNIGGSRRPDPEDINPTDEIDYAWKAEGYAAQGKKQEALDTCAAMKADYRQLDIDICLLHAYDELDDLDGQIEIYERRLIEQLAAGDSGALTEHVLEGLKEQRDKKR